MKKMLALLVAALVLSSTASTAFAAKTEINQLPDSQEIGVFGTCEYQKNFYEIKLGVEGQNTVTLPDGVVLSGVSSSTADDGLRVIIIPVTASEEADAYAWVSESVSKLGAGHTTYYIAFYRGDTPVRPEGSVEITLSKSGDGETRKLYYMNGNAETSRLDCSVGSSDVAFQAAEEGYYVFVEDSSIKPTIRALDETDTEIDRVVAKEMFIIEAVTSDDVQRIMMFNEYGLRMGLKSITRTDNGDGTVTWRAQMSIDTVSKSRTITLTTVDVDGVQTVTDASITLEVVAAKAHIMSAIFLDESAVVNQPVKMRVVTDMAAAKIEIHNEYGLKMGIVKSTYMDVDGERIWEVTLKIGTAGQERIFDVRAKDRNGELTDPVKTNAITITKQ